MKTNNLPLTLNHAEREALSLWCLARGVGVSPMIRHAWSVTARPVKPLAARRPGRIQAL